jgi:hypothetical protein
MIINIYSTGVTRGQLQKHLFTNNALRSVACSLKSEQFGLVSSHKYEQC